MKDTALDTHNKAPLLSTTAHTSALRGSRQGLGGGKWCSKNTLSTFCYVASALFRYCTSTIKEELNHCGTLCRPLLNGIPCNYFSHWLQKISWRGFLDAPSEFLLCPYSDKSQPWVPMAWKERQDDMQIDTVILNSESPHLSFTFPIPLLLRHHIIYTQRGFSTLLIILYIYILLSWFHSYYPPTPTQKSQSN